MTALHRRPLACLVLSLACLAAAACTTLKPRPEPAPEIFRSAWELFRTEYMQPCPARDFFVRASVNLSSGERSSRFLITFWGRTTFPVRMDLQAGIGAMLAHWREDQQGWLGYHPATKEAFYSHDSRAGAALLGLTMPLRLDAFARVIGGCWEGIVPAEYSATRFALNRLEYLLEHQGQTVVLALTPEGRPLSLRLDDPSGWVMTIEEWLRDDRSRPGRIALQQGDDVAVVRVQRLDFDFVTWQENDLDLELPPGTVLRLLDSAP